MSKKLQDAMPIGSRWSAHHHVLDKSLGERTVRAHRSRDIVFVNHAKDDNDTFLSYPRASHITINPLGNTVVISDDNNTNLPLLTYTRVNV